MILLQNRCSRVWDLGPRASDLQGGCRAAMDLQQPTVPSASDQFPLSLEPNQDAAPALQQQKAELVEVMVPAVYLNRNYIGILLW